MKYSTTTISHRLVKTLASFALGVGMYSSVGASAALLGVNGMQGVPLTSYNNVGMTTYVAGTQAFSITGAEPLAVLFPPPMTVFNSTNDGPKSVTLNISVDNSGNLVGGVPGDDLVVVGRVDDGAGTVYDGVLLTGEVLAFGFQEAGASDFYDFRFVVTGGQMAPLFAGQDIGVTTVSEGSSFTGDFTVDFGGRAKGNIGPIPPIDALASLGDRVWNDLNADGIQDCDNTGGLDSSSQIPGDGGSTCSEPGIPNVTVRLLTPGQDGDCATGGPLVTSTTTDANGFYLFENLQPGAYCVEFDKGSVQNELDCNNIIGGVQSSPANVGDDILDSDADPVTGRTGNIDLASGENDLSNDAGYYCPAKIGDMLVNDLNRDGIQDPGEPGVNGQDVDLVDCATGDVIDSTTTEPVDGIDGMYMFNPLPPGEYSVIFSKPVDTVFSPQDQGSEDVDCDTNPNGETACVVLGPDEYNQDVDACINVPPAGLGDFVWEDKNVNGVQDDNEPGIEGVTVNLLVPGNDGICNAGFEGDADVEVGTTTTGAGGAYQFINLDPGTYCVEFELPADDFCTTDGFPLGAPKFTLRNVGADDKDSDADRRTGKTGNIPLGPNDFDPTNDAGIYCPAKIGDRVWEDDNKDGLQDNGEPGVGGIEVQLFSCGPDGEIGGGDDSDTGERRFTDGGDNGMYMFGAEPGVFDLEPGDYYVKFVAPGRMFTTPDAGDEAIDSDCLPPSGISACVPLGSRGVNLNRDCGLIPPPPPSCDLSIEKTCRVETPPPPAFDKCDGKLEQFTVLWTGGDITVSGPQNDAPGGQVSTNQEVTFFGPFSDNDVFVGISGDENGQSKFHMSCSDDDFNSPDDCGKFAGNGKGDDSDFINLWKLEGFVDAEGTVLDCTSGSGGDFPDQDNCQFTPQPANCEVLDKPTSLTFRYTGQGCGASMNGQDSGKAECTGDVNGMLPVAVVAGDEDLNDLYNVNPPNVAPGETFTMSTTDKFDSNSRIRISNSGGAESNTFHTSCSQPLAVGDKYGSLELVAFNGVSGGADVTYGYTVTNNGDTLTLTTITDNKLGPIAGPFALGGGQTERFTQSASVFETTTNVATVTGQTDAGGECRDTDEVTVEVAVPPGPPVSCSDIKDITELSMVWNGADGVDIVTNVGQQFSGVNNGNQITFSTVDVGNDVILSLSGGASGTSEFHISCSDDDMDGSEDCGNAQGNGKSNDSSLNNQWLFDGMTGEQGSFACGLPISGVVDPTPGPVGGHVMAAGALEFSDDKIKWELTNMGIADVYLIKVKVEWPGQHEELDKMKLDGDFAKDVGDTSSPTTLDEDDFEDDASKRRIKADDDRKLEIEFVEKYKGSLPYTITVWFDNGQELTITDHR